MLLGVREHVRGTAAVALVGCGVELGHPTQVAAGQSVATALLQVRVKRRRARAADLQLVEMRAALEPARHKRGRGARRGRGRGRARILRRGCDLKLLVGLLGGGACRVGVSVHGVKD